MIGLPKIIDNDRVELGEILRSVAIEHQHLSIATGYWDLPGTQEILESVKHYESIRLLIGQEPLIPRHARELKIDSPDPDFPDQDIAFDLTLLEDDSLRETILDLKELIEEGRLEVRIYRKSFLHAKAYIFGDYRSKTAIGIIGSSNFTKAGLTTNTELNALEPNYQVVKFKPMAESDEHGHLSWFDSLWHDEQTEIWDKSFIEIMTNSPLGDKAFGPYDMYIRTLMEVYPDELLPKAELADETTEVLFWFQRRNAQILINKLERMGLAMLSDSVGLGKTITAGAVMKHYQEADATRIYVIAPASLKQQWKEDLAARFGMTQGFEVISLQDSQAIEDARRIDQFKSVDLFVIDESHNLRNENSKRHLQLLDWFIDNPDSKVLMLTATPINNSLMDFVSQIQLASKGQLNSIDVDYRDEKNRLHKIDFFDALKRIQSRISRAEKEGKKFNWSSIREVVASGLRHYLVRSTRQGIKAAGGIKLADGTTRDFPESRVMQIGYHYSEETAVRVKRILQKHASVFENVDPHLLDVDSLLELTQRSRHPLEEVRSGKIPQTDQYVGNVFVNIFQVVLLLGFAPYKPDIYTHRIYGKSKDDIRSLGLEGEESFRVQSQLSIHNMLRITFLKRIESSQAAFRKSLENYQQKLEIFEEFLDNGLILTFEEIYSITDEYGEDVEKAVHRYRAENGTQNLADPDSYNISALRLDIKRDKKLVAVLIDLATSLSIHDEKLSAFAEKIQEVRQDPNPAARKILVFSYFADTIKYLEETLPGIIEDLDFQESSAFLTGGDSSSVESIVGRFSPISKKWSITETAPAIDYLFATDVLSEGQNLQDSGTLINYDLHWNPVRMIQRNGRINRLGSEFEEVFIYNMKPEDSLETYLKLSKRLERKISTIKHTIGTDQNITRQGQIAPREYLEDIDTSSQELLDDLGNFEAKTKALEDEQDFDTALLYGENGGRALEELTAEENEFYIEDEFVYELRNFLASSTEEEIDRLKSIPAGKWGYFPKATSLRDPQIALGLARVTGKIPTTGNSLSNTQFIKVECWGDHRASPLEDVTALKYLRTGPEDNERKSDKIKTDRSLVRKRVHAATRAQLRKAPAVYQPKKSEIATLHEFEKLLPGRNLAKLIMSKIANSRELKKAQRILRTARAELRVHGQILADSIRAMDDLSIELGSKFEDEKIINDIKSVLFYAKQ